MVLPLRDRVDPGAMAMQGYSGFLWRLTIRWLNVISRTLIWESYPFSQMHSVYSTSPADWACIDGTLTGTTTPGKGINGNEGVIQIPSCWASILDIFFFLSEHFFKGCVLPLSWQYTQFPKPCQQSVKDLWKF